MFPFENAWLLLCLLPLAALLYASVGHGGASAFLALMTLFNVPVPDMKPTALVLNLFVAGIAFLLYYRHGHFNWKLFYPFALGSVPAAFVGGYFNTDPFIYKKILGILLIISLLRIVGVFGEPTGIIRPLKFYQGVIIGAAIGFLSGLIGIGGGIILSPVILLLHWAGMKETAAVSALFIWINSVSGLGGLLVSGASIPLYGLAFVVLATAGGFAGGALGSGRFGLKTLTYLLSVVLFVASLKLLFT